MPCAKLSVGIQAQGVRRAVGTVFTAGSKVLSPGRLVVAADVSRRYFQNMARTDVRGYGFWKAAHHAGRKPVLRFSARTRWNDSSMRASGILPDCTARSRMAMALGTTSGS